MAIKQIQNIKHSLEHIVYELFEMYQKIEHILISRCHNSGAQHLEE